jgi:PleD family two-component response regulator
MIQYQSVCRDVRDRKNIERERGRLVVELNAAKDALHFQETHDGLAGLRNRAEILSKLCVELARAARAGDGLSEME